MGIEKIHLVGHDIGSWVAVSYALYYKDSLKTVTIMDAGIPGMMPSELFQPENAHKIWQFYFHAVNEIPEFLVEGKEKEYLAWYFSNKSHIKTAINQQDLEIYYKAYKGMDKMKNGFEYYRSFMESSAQNNASSSKINVPVLAIGGQYALGNQVGTAIKKVASNVKSESIEACGHYIPEEQPQKLIELIDKHINRSRKQSI